MDTSALMVRMDQPVVSGKAEWMPPKGNDELILYRLNELKEDIHNHNEAAMNRSRGVDERFAALESDVRSLQITAAKWGSMFGVVGGILGATIPALVNYFLSRK